MAEYQKPGRIKQFLITHDYSKVFFLLYLISSVALSIIFNLGFFVFLAVIHYFMDIYKYRHGGLDYKTSSIASLRDCMADVMFIFIGYVSALVFSAGFGLGIIRTVQGEEMILASMRTQEQIAIKGMKTIKLVPKVFLGERAMEATSYMITAASQRKIGNLGSKFKYKPFNPFEKAMIAITVACAGFILAAPLVYGISYGQVWQVVVKESIPRFESHFI